MAELVVAFPKAEEAKAVKNILVKNGYHVVATALNGAAALHQASVLEEGILICAYGFPDMIYTEIRLHLDAAIRMLLIAHPSRVGEELPENVIFLPIPLKVHTLLECLKQLEERGSRSGRRRRRSMQRSAEDLAILDKAKALLMEKKGMREDEAHRHIQKTSMNRGGSMVETAAMFISLYQEERE